MLLALWKEKKNHGDLPIIKARLLLLVKNIEEIIVCPYRERGDLTMTKEGFFVKD